MDGGTAASTERPDALEGPLLAGAGRVATRVPRLPPSGPQTPSRQRLLVVALGCFAERGFHGTSVRDLARALGIQPASVYSLVSSKEHLLAELVTLGHSAHAAAVEQAVERSGPRSADRLTAFMHAHVEVHARWPMLAVVSNNELPSLPVDLAQPGLVLRRRVSHLLQEIVQQGARDGEFDVPDTVLVVAALGAMGMRVAAWFDGDEREIERVASVYATLALRLVSA